MSKNKIALITGITGQDGSYLSKFLLGKGYEIYGIIRDTSTPNIGYLEYLGIAENIRMLKANLSDLSNIIKQLIKYTMTKFIIFQVIFLIMNSVTITFCQTFLCSLPEVKVSG